ncbi:MAG TPA: M1 family aminopeptidase [Thermoanaerobaculia bacterium]|nr:M1 family aminopeptidase [Thermoanaerobaculia bacterium]
MFLPIALLLLSTGLDVRRYSARLELKADALEGAVELQLATPAPDVRLSAFGMEIRGVTCGDRAIAFEHRQDELRFDSGAATRCSIEYRAAPATYTVFHTGTWMPSNPSISDRAAFELHMPDAIAFGTGGNEFPAYLLGYASGKFTEVAIDPIIKIHATSLRAEQLAQAFRDTPAMMKFFAERAGIPYPLPSYDQVVIDGAPPQELAGGTLLSTNYVKAVLDNPAEDYLIAHELAHQWWGNLVTAKDWSEFWLHEGLATYMVAAWKAHRWSQEAYDREIALASQRMRKAWQSKQVPLVTPEAPTVDRALIYSRGALVLHLLQRRLGSEKFWNGLAAYTKAGRAKPVTTNDLAAAMKLPRFFEQWTQRAALPDVHVTHAVRGRNIRITLTQSEPLFELQLRLIARSVEGETSKTILFNTAKKTITMRAPKGELASVAIDPNDTVLGTFTYD